MSDKISSLCEDTQELSEASGKFFGRDEKELEHFATQHNSSK